MFLNLSHQRGPVDHRTGLRELASLDDHSWVYFQTSWIGNRQVLVPYIGPKPNWVLRVVHFYRNYWLQQMGLRDPNSVLLARSLEAVIVDADRNSHSSGISYKEITDAAQSSLKILNKLMKKHPEIANAHQRTIQNIATRDEKTFKKLVFKMRLDDWLKGKRFSQKFYTVASKIDWDADSPLFDEKGLCRVQQHLPLGVSKKIDDGHRLKFLKFVGQLLEKNPKIVDHYDRSFTQGNVARLKKMMAAIVNELYAKENEPDFQERFAAAVIQISLALDNCTNGINTNIEALFYNLCGQKGGSLDLQVQLTLQKMRDDIFRKVIQKVIKESDKPEYYLEHEAASVNYYYAYYAEAFGLPSSVSKLDRSSYDNYAYKVSETRFRQLFMEDYTLENIAKHLLEVVNNPEDRAISTKGFQTWLGNTYKGNNPYEDLLEEDGTYKIDCVLNLLIELGFVSQQVPKQGWQSF